MMSDLVCVILDIITINIYLHFGSSPLACSIHSRKATLGAALEDGFPWLKKLLSVSQSWVTPKAESRSRPECFFPASPIRQEYPLSSWYSFVRTRTKSHASSLLCPAAYLWPYGPYGHIFYGFLDFYGKATMFRDNMFVGHNLIFTYAGETPIQL